MKKIALLPVIAALFLGNASHLQAQILNGSFSSGNFTDWTVVGGSSGGPEVVTSGPPTPPVGSTQALVQSTDPSQDIPSVSATAIQTAFNAADTADTSSTALVLPPTVGDNVLYTEGTFSPTNGQAIYQTFTLSAEATLSFTYSFQTNDYYPYDSTGYVLDGTYTQLASPPPFGTVGPNTAPGYAYGTNYATLSLSLGPGTHTLGFVAYNTNDEYASSALYVTDVSVPEPSAWELIVLGGVSLLIVGKLRSKLSAS